MTQVSIILIATLIVLITKASCQSSPCPEVFQYESNGQSKYGIITIPAPEEGSTVLEVKIGTKKAINYDKSRSLGLLKDEDSTLDDVIKGNPMQYILYFPTSRELPIIMHISLDNRRICTGQELNNFNTWTFKHNFTYTTGSSYPIHNPNSIQNVPIRTNRRPTRPTTAPPIFTRTTERSRDTNPARPIDTSWLQSLPLEETCGRQTRELQSTQLVLNGQSVKQGEFPWLVALFHYQGRLLAHKCGGNLISNTYVITAAHCIMNQRRVYLEFGRYDITNPNEEDYVIRVSLKITPHPEYVSGADSDVALILIEHIEFTPKIRPICLGDLGSNLDKKLSMGLVIGWGREVNDGKTSSTPMKTKVRKVGLDTCRNSNEKFHDIATDKTFCAGGMNSGPCHGDSGGGFYTPLRDVWYLRGIISTSIGNEFYCEFDEYAVYVDLVLYLDWLRQVMIGD